MCLLVLLGTVATASAADRGAEVADYANHPRLLFTIGDVPALRAKVSDGGADDAAYAYIHARFTGYYLTQPFDSLLRNDFALEAMLNTGLVAYIEDPVESSALALGKALTQHIAATWGVDTDPYSSALRLRALAIGYDLFFENASEAERDAIRAEIASYVSYMTGNMNYDIWRWSPYVSNKTAMVAATLGLGSIVLDGEADPLLTSAGLARADVLYAAWRDAHLSDGAYREGTLYATWSLRHLIYYFEARKRFDGFDYAADTLVRNVEKWFPYELDPRGGARLNNLQDQTDYYLPLARHNTYWDWAMSAWGSKLAAYVWEHAVGTYGVDMFDESDKAATVLWHANVAPANPVTKLPLSQVWEARGLYYFRTGWPNGAASNDVVFSLYSGEFRGGHAQEDQNQFTLAAYGEKLVLDHGAGSAAKQSEAHNLVHIDGLGQHNAGSSIGTDGRIESHVLCDFGDYVCGDARLAYSTHSPYNNPGVPYPWSDWSWGLHGANPVERAYRRVIAVRGSGSMPYFVIQDDIQKDQAEHLYQWRMHVASDATVDAPGSGPVRVTKNAAVLDVHAVHPPLANLAVSVTPFDNMSEDPNSRVLSMRIDDVNPLFTFILFPRRVTDPVPTVSTVVGPPATTATLDWGGGVIDYVFVRTDAAAAYNTSAAASSPCAGPPSTDAALGVVRKNGNWIEGYVLAEATVLACGATEMVRIDDGPATVSYDGADIYLSRPDADFHILATGVWDVYHDGTRIPTTLVDGYLTNATYTGVGSAPRRIGLDLRAFPNPFNPTVRVAFVVPVPADVRVDIHDAAGRRVVVLAAQPMTAGEHAIVWNGRGDDGQPAASGVYFVRVRAGATAQALKLVLVR